jgi:protein-S-isoprenylcysteine O-methyltransferase Ste14
MFEIAAGIIIAVFVLGAIGSAIAFFEELNDLFDEWPAVILVGLVIVAVVVGSMLYQTGKTPNEVSLSEWRQVLGVLVFFVGAVALAGLFEWKLKKWTARQRAKRVARAICAHHDTQVLKANRRRRGAGHTVQEA